MTKYYYSKAALGISILLASATLVSCIQRGYRTLGGQTSRVSESDAAQDKRLTMDVLVDIRQKLLDKKVFGEVLDMDEYLGALKAHPLGRELFSNFTAAYRSIAEQDASPEHPRVIMTNEYGSITLTFNSGTLAGHDQIEIIDVHPDTSERQMFQLFFPIEKGKTFVEVPKKNPASCMNCHDSRLGAHHLWGQYPQWDGIIGGVDDFLSPVEGTFHRKMNDCPDDPSKLVRASATVVREYEILQSLRKSVKEGKPRYRHLVFPDDAPSTYPYTSNPKGKISERPNFRFGAVWHRHHIDHFLKTVKNRGKLQEFSPAFLYGYFSCESLIDKSLAYEIRKKYLNGSERKMTDSEWMEMAMHLVKMRIIDLSINELPNKRDYTRGFSPGSERSIVLVARLLLEEDAVNSRQYPHQTYSFKAPQECEAVYEYDRFPSLQQFGFNPTLKTPNDSVLMCNAIAKQMLK
jgi:hypothetical protein